ncbi:MAG: hypothetical protein Q9169_004520 [Polycauliona sp. 2 TL-2023]
MVQAFLHVPVPAQITPVLPFEKLPHELQRMVLREAFPKACLKPDMPRSSLYQTIWSRWDEDLVVVNKWWHSDEEGSFFNYLRKIQDEPNHYEESLLPIHLLRVSQPVTAITRSICIGENPLVINITPVCLNILRKLITREYEYPTSRDLAHIKHCKALPNFALDFNFHDAWWKHEFQRSVRKDDIVWWAQPKEWLRTVCDSLVTNHSIEEMSVQLPCFCSLTTPELVSQARIVMLDLLEPLKQLRVSQPVQFIWNQKKDGDVDAPNCSTPGGHRCNQENLGKDIVDTLQKCLGQLNGEKVSRQEQSWKWVKAIPRVPARSGERTTKARERLLWHLHDYLDDISLVAFNALKTTLDVDLEKAGFDSMAENVEKELWDMWNQHVQQKTQLRSRTEE